MQKVIILQVIFCLFLMAGKALAISTTASTNFGDSPSNKDFIVIVDILQIGSNAPPLYSEVCSGSSGSGISNGQVIALPQVTSSMPSVTPVKFGFHPMLGGQSLPFTFAEFYAWVGCDGNIVFADLRLWGGMQQTFVKGPNGNTDVLLFFPGTPSSIRLAEAPGGAITVTLTAAEGVQCTDINYNSLCFEPGSAFRNDDNSGFALDTPTATLAVQPNPFTYSFESTLNLTQDGDVKVALVDMMGREVRSLNFTGTKGTNQFTVEGEDLPSGMYFLSVQTAEERLVEQVLKNN